LGKPIHNISSEIHWQPLSVLRDISKKTKESYENEKE